MPNDTSVKLPGGEMCPGGTCKKVQTLIRSKFNPTKKRYNIGSVKPKPTPKPDVKRPPAPSF